MTFLVPAWLAGTAVLMAAVLALHLLARSRPRPAMLPTARFVPDRPATATALARRPADLLLLLLRLLVVALLGLSFAQPIRPGTRTVRLVLLDSARISPALDSATQALVKQADAVISFGTPDQGALSAALVAAVRAASAITTPGDSVLLAIVSPFPAEAFDAATQRIRRQWKGRIHLVVLPPRVFVARSQPPQLAADDPLAATLAGGSFPARLVRGLPSAADSAWAREGGALVMWPRTPAQPDAPAASGDTVNGVAMSGIAIVARFRRDAAPPPGTAVAFWLDGQPAATAAPLGQGCVRWVAVPVPETGDLVLRESFVRFARQMLQPCQGQLSSGPAAPHLLDSLRGGQLAPAHLAGKRNERRVPANPWLLLGAALLYAGEPLLRRRVVAR